MARSLFSIIQPSDFTPDAAPRTIFTWVTGAQTKIVLLDVMINPQATADGEPLIFDIATGATDNGTSSDAAANIIKDIESTDETIDITARRNFTGEPAGTMVPRRQFAVSRLRGDNYAAFHKPFEPFVCIRNTRYSLRSIGATGVAILPILRFEQ